MILYLIIISYVILGSVLIHDMIKLRTWKLGLDAYAMTIFAPVTVVLFIFFIILITIYTND